MKGIITTLLLILSILSFSQVLTVDNCYIISMQGVNKTPLDFNEDAFNAFILEVSPPIEIIEQKIEGHIFVNIFIKNNIIKETSLMIGLNTTLDSIIVNHLKSTNIAWIGSGKLDPEQRIVMSIKVNYRDCKLENVSKSNLLLFSSNNELNQKTITKFKREYNSFNTIFFFDSTNIQYYKNAVPKSTIKRINEDLKSLSWYNPIYSDKEIILDIDKNNIPNVILQQNDSVFILENNKLLFSEIGRLKFIRRKQKEIIIELESICSECKKDNKTLSFYHKDQELYTLSNTVTSYNNYPQLLDTIHFKKTIITAKKCYIRSKPFKINEPFNNCTGTASEEYNCIVSKTWGNIFGEIDVNTQLNVIQEFVDVTKKTWYFVLANRNDGLFLGWVSNEDVKEKINKNIN